MLFIFFLLLFTNAQMRMDLKAAQFPINNISKKDGIIAEISNRRIYYTAAFKVGSEEDEVEVLVEMILNLLWFPTLECDTTTTRGTPLAIFICVTPKVPTHPRT